jgi:phenylacetic acid degradation operon negative regulatory protein
MAAASVRSSRARIARTRQGSPPSLLLTLLGDYWWGRQELLPSAALVDLLADFDVTDAAARAALSRLVKHGLLHSTKSGRNTFYGLTERASAILTEGNTRIFEFGKSGRPWSGEWTLVAFSIPESSRSIRGSLRTRLRWLGFAPLYDGLWISPHARHEQALRELHSLGIATATAFRATVPEGGSSVGLPRTAWNMDEVTQLYESFIDSTRDLGSRLDSGSLDNTAALVERTRLMDAWRFFPTFDPDIPEELLPDDWPRPEARELFLATYDRLGPQATLRVREAIAAYAPDIADFAAYHRSDR